MLSMYPACFYKEKDGQYSVIFPDLNVSTCGENLEDAVRMAVDCLAGWLYTAKIDKEEIPEPSDFTKIDPDEYYDDYEKAFVNIISVDVDEYAKKYFNKSVKKTLTIPEWLNKLAVENNINFSKVLQNALKQELHIDN